MKIKAREVNNTFREVIESGNIIVNAKGKDWSIPYNYTEKYDDMFSDYDKDWDFDFKRAGFYSKEWNEEEIENLQEKMIEEFDKIKVI